MSWTYGGNPANSPLEEVRFLVGDTIPGQTITLSDQEIEYNIALVYGATPPASGNFLPAAYCADFLQSKYAGQVDSKTVGKLSISFSNRAERFAKLAANLRRRATLAGAPIYAGGQTHSDKSIDENDTDIQQPGAKVDQFNYFPQWPGNDPFER